MLYGLKERNKNEGKNDYNDFDKQINKNRE
jgi:hypothetical protein